MICLGLIACSGMDFEASERVDSTQSGELNGEIPLPTNGEEESSDDASIVAEPVSVGGAFLACRYENAKSDSEHQVGCEVRNGEDKSLAGLVEVDFSLTGGGPINHLLELEDVYPFKLQILGRDLGNPMQSIQAAVKGQEGGQEKTVTAELPVNEVEQIPEPSLLAGFSLGVMTIQDMPVVGNSGAVKLPGDRCLVSTEDAFSGGTKIKAETCQSDSDQQVFFLNDLGGGEFSIQDDENNCFDIPLENGVYLPRVNVFQNCHLSINQRFAIKEKNGFKTLVSLAGGERCFGIDPASKTDILLQECEDL